MTDPISFDPFLGWVDTTDPDNLPEDVRIIGANDLLRYENFGVAATAKINAEIVRVDDHETRLDAHDTTLTGLDTRLDTLEGQNIGRVRFVRKTANTTRTNTAALMADPDLTVTLGPNEVVEVTILLYVDTPTSADFRFALAGPGVVSGRWGMHDMQSVGGTSSPNGQSIGLNTIGAQQQFLANGIISAGPSGGVMAVWWSQLTSGTGTDVSVLSDSYLKTRTISGG